MPPIPAIALVVRCLNKSTPEVEAVFEVGNVLVMAERRGRISRDDATRSRRIIGNAEPGTRHPALDLRCQYLELARRMNLHLATLQARLKEAVIAEGIEAL